MRALYLFLLTLTLLLHAESPRPFADKDGDLLADPPGDTQAWRDPPTLVFSYAPHESPTLYREIWRDFLDYLARVTGKKVIYFPYQTGTAQLEAMKYGRLHVSGFSTGMTPRAVREAGFHPFVVMADAKGRWGYTMRLITYPGSGIRTIGDIRGKTLLLTTPSSNSGCRLPLHLLRYRYDMREGRDFFTRYSGSHGRSIRRIVRHKDAVAAVAGSVLHRMIARGEIDASQIVTIYRSRRFPTTAYGYRYDLKPDLVRKIQHAFLTFPWFIDKKPSSLRRAFDDKARFVPIDYRKDWAPVRALQEEGR
ncbi:MAG: phosphate/phosphite/phosphonate ABC transporter substrate-binding protein [Epsilonproteobacteria bacterium]|nr:phosphate/phosphite/phosphonate ABC transporter substrate-binding protein [Campylobacterota bacterium]